MMDSSLSFKKNIDELRKTFLTGKTKSIEWRLKQLHGLLKMVDEESDAICEALKKDLNKCLFEAEVFEISVMLNEIVEAIDNLKQWMKPEHVKGNLLTLLDSHFTKCEPLGVVLIIGAWNYPFQLTILPLIGAIAAGNCVVCKPSEMAIHSAELFEMLVPKYLDDECIKVINGGVYETTALLKERFDHILYTGGSAVGKIVMRAATEFLTPVTLELGGKSPVIIDDSSDLRVAARRTLFGKLCNSGQTCIAPDYILCTKVVQDNFIGELKLALDEFICNDPEKDGLSRIINTRHFQRIKSLMEKGNIVIGGKYSEDNCFMELTVLTDVSLQDPIMQEEIFGPLLPMITVENIDEAIDIVNSREKPLSMYIFSKDQSAIDQIVSSTSSGAVCINDTLMQNSMTTLPFGGVGNSGMGIYHGKFTFLTFSHKRSFYVRSQNFEFINTMKYRPFSTQKLNLVKKILVRSPRTNLFYWLSLFVLGIILSYAFLVL